MVTARNTAYYLARKYTNLSLKEIGNHFNRRHSTVLKGITNLEREIQHNTQIGGQAQRLEQRLQN
jgi:chromosomal replication initiator protein